MSEDNRALTPWQVTGCAWGGIDCLSSPTNGAIFPDPAVADMIHNLFVL